MLSGENILNHQIKLVEANETKKTGDITVSIDKLNKAGDKVNDNGEYYYIHIIIDGLTINQKYSVTLSGESFINYTYDNIDISSNSQRLVIADTKGTFAIGNLNDDNIIDEKDYDLLKNKIEAITEEVSKEDLKKYDLNNDGIIDIVDLSYIANNMVSEIKPELQSRQPIVSKAKVIVDEKTKIEGNVNTLVDSENGETVKIKTTNEESISESNPVTLEIDYDKALQADEIRIERGNDNMPSEMTITVETDGAEEDIVIEYPFKTEEAHAFSLEDAVLIGEADNTPIVINLGKQIAVKKITIKITKTVNADATKTPNLAEIATVELLNNVYEQLPPPDMSLVSNLKLDTKAKTINATWNHATNVTGYKLVLKYQKDGKEQVMKAETTNNSYSFSDLKNGTTYTLEIWSVNRNLGK